MAREWGHLKAILIASFTWLYVSHLHDPFIILTFSVTCSKHISCELPRIFKNMNVHDVKSVTEINSERDRDRDRERERERERERDRERERE